MTRQMRAGLLVGVAALVGAGCGGPPSLVVPPEPTASAAAVDAGPGAVEVSAEPDVVSAACAPYDAEIAKSYEPYIDAYSNEAFELSPDGKRLLFRSTRAGSVPQLYVASPPSAEPTAVAAATDRVGYARFSPDGKTILFQRDHDHDENWQLLRADADGSNVEALTAAPDQFHQLPWVSPDSRTVYYFRGRHADPTYELVAQPIEGGAARSVFRGEGFHFVSDISPDGARVLVSKLHSLSRSELLAVGLATGKAQQLAPGEGAQAHAHSGVFSADGKSVYVVTDEGTDRAALRRIDAATGKMLGSFEDTDAEVGGVLAAPRGSLLAVLLDAGSHRSVRLLDAKTLREKRRVKLPLAKVMLGRFTRDGRRLVVTVSEPSAPTDAFVVDTRTGVVGPLRSDPRPGLAQLTKVRASVVRVPTFDSFEVPVNVYLPETLPENERGPVMVRVHGGPASSSTVDWDPFTAFYISRGFRVIEPNVRGSTGFGKAYEKADNGRKRMDALRDLAAVNAWLREQPWADPDRLVVFGGSYGGYMTYMALGHQPELWRAGVGLVGVVNLRTFMETTTGAIRLAFREEFGEPETEGNFLDSISPIRMVDHFRAPLLVYQGATDPRVPRSEQDQLVRALRERRLPLEYMVAADEGHSLDHRHNKLEFLGRMIRFLDQHLERGQLPAGCGQ